MSLPYDVNESPEGGGHSSLGMFCTLPVEIRLIIWEHLFKTIRQAATWNSSWNPLSIMCCSSTLHHEISHHLYRELSLHVIIHTHIFRWGVLEVHSEKFHIQCVRDIKDKIVARDRLRAFPCQKFRIPEIAVSIDAPYEGDEGRRILSAQKVTQFVDILHELPQVPRVRVALVGEWVGERRPFLDHSPLGYYQMDHQKLNRRQIFDFDVAIMPFTGLTDWDYSIPSDLHTLLFTDERVKGTFLYQFRDHDSYNISPSKHLPEEVAQKAPRERLIFRRLVDRELDQAYGENAGILQSERVQSWYEPNDSWNSQYEKQLWRDLAADFDATMMIDPELNATRMRFKTVILCHDIAYKWFAKLPRRSLNCPLSYIWNPDAIGNRWPLGRHLRKLPSIEPEDDDLLSSRFNRYITELPHCREFWEDLDWWRSSAYSFMSKILIGPKVCPQCLILNSPCQWCQKFDVNRLCPLCKETMSSS